MKISSRTAALAVVLALVATVVVVRRPVTGPAEIAAASLDPTAFLHVQEADHSTGSSDPQDHGEGETAAEAEQYAGEQDAATQPPQWRAITDHENATLGPEQPIPFNHRFHVTDLQIDCMYCHSGTEQSVSGIVPAMEVCMGCHRVAGSGLPPVEEMREMYDAGQRVEWEWVNKLPEFVQFSHQPHLRNGLSCQTCHGPVEEMYRVYQWASFTMGWCLECHRQPPADTDVATDHALAELTPPPQPPGPQQPGSFYPRAIDTQYGATRAPTDCAACHY